ncbi:hypothetical protein Ahy_A02g009021 [Arachis hypogaea]|uniref:Transposase MuDR plant domain-containing protein n=1 Tax=Arachis hypogaea TaxID=3818 RepID=A0A445EFX6_ARAHY|nr:hypothetical protein Ahy_A02g009021 [Arachis hypogaea]
MHITDDASMQQMLYIYQQTQFHVPMIKLYVEFEQQSGLGAVGEEGYRLEEDNNDSEADFEANYEVDDENDDGDLAGNPTVQNEANAIVSQHPFGVPSFMRTLDLEAMHAQEFPNEGNTAAEDGEFSVGMKFGSRESVISAIKGYTISRGVDYTVSESEPQTFYAKCKGYGAGCDCLIRASLIRKKACWEIRRYNSKHTCTVGTISQDHAKLVSDTIADTIRQLVEVDPSIKVKSVITKVQSRFNYTLSYRKAWLAKQKAIAKVFSDWKVSYQTLPVWLKAMTMKMPRSHVQIKTLPVYRESEEVQVEGKVTDAWEFFLTNLWRYVFTTDGVGIIYDRHTSIDATIARSKGAWSPPRAWHMYCIRHIRSNFLRRFKAPYLHKLVAILRRNKRTTKTTKGLKSGMRHILNGAMTSVLRDGCWHSMVSIEVHERLRNRFTYSEFTTKRVEESFRRAENIVVNRFDRRNEMFKVCEMQDGTIYIVNLAQRHYDCGHFQVERLPCCHVLGCCVNQRLDWQVYVHDMYKMSEICKVYRGEFVPMGDPSTWDRYEGAKVIANWTLRRTTKGRPKLTR